MAEFPLIRPRVLSEHSAEPLYIEDHLEPILERADAGAICIYGPQGSGKSCALKSLIGRLPKRTIIELLDNPERARVADLAERMIVIYAAAEPHDLPHLAKFWLVPWGEDEALDYLMARHKDQCKSVMPRIRGGEPLDLPELWTICLDRMAEEESIPDVDAALRRHLDKLLPGWLRPKARNICFTKTVDHEAEGVDEVLLWGQKGFLGFLMGHGLPADAVRLIRNERVRRILAAEKLVNPADGFVHLEGLRSRLTPPLIRMAGRILATHPDAVPKVDAALQTDQTTQAMGASLLHAAGTGWRPADEGRILFFHQALLSGASWRNLKLTHALFGGADVTRADFSGATLEWADFGKAAGRRSVFRDAVIPQFHAEEAEFDGADFQHARADKARFVDAKLRGADFEGAALPESRFIGADLTRARFCRADLSAARFQVQLKGEDPAEMFRLLKHAREIAKFQEELRYGIAGKDTVFAETDFTGANLEGAILQRADLRTAELSGALLVRADLIAANLEGVTIVGARLEEARLNAADLTGSTLTGASMVKASLKGAKLADIDWERVNLRDADLRGVTFHMGSSRSGLVFGEPSEGTRSGFYTDEFHDQNYRAPEEIRVANLRGADLRGAVLRNSDFYLVDLREALYSPEQEAYLRRCGAILETRV